MRRDAKPDESRKGILKRREKKQDEESHENLVRPTMALALERCSEGGG